MILIGIVVVVIVGGLFVYSTFLVDDDESADSTTTTLAGAVEPECGPVDGPPEDAPRSWTGPFPSDCLDPNKQYTAVFDTSHGEIRVRMNTASTPETVNNFVNLARWGYFDGSRIFRTDPDLQVIQGGEADPSDPGPGYTIPDEGSGYTYTPGQLVMARTEAPDSASSQYFFVAGEAAASLNAQGTYVVFGSTNDAGLQVVNDILALAGETPDPNTGFFVPTEEVTVNSVRIVERDAEPAGSTTTAAP
jgi:cyclophilin family peptidyl-prolyl cis-trans isomerase